MKLSLSNFLLISVAELPTDHENSFMGASAVTSASRQGAIIQKREHFYEVTCEISGCSWSILAQKLDVGVTFGVMMTFPPEYTSTFCEGK